MRKVVHTACLCFLLLGTIIANTDPNSITFDLCYNDTGQMETVTLENFISNALLTIETDDCASAVALATDGSVTDNGDNSGSTQEAGEPIPTGLTSPISSVWYTITTAAPNTTVTIDFTLTGITDPVISIYDDMCLPTTSFFEQTVTASGPINACLPAGTYRVQVATDAGNEGTYSINVNATTANSPANEDCSGTLPVLANGTNTGLDNTCSTDGMVWFEYTVTTGDHVDVTTPTAGFSVAQMLLSDCSTTITNTSCLAPGEVIHIEAGSATNYGMFDLEVTESDNAELHDDCADLPANPTILNCAGIISGSGNSNTCPDPEDDGSCAGTGSPGVWHLFDVSIAVKTFEITGSNFQVFTGTCGSLTSLGCAGDASLASIDVDVSGTRYYVLVFDDGTTSGNFSATANPGIPANEACSVAEVATDAVAVTGTTTCGLAPTAGFCNANGANDHVVWYSYTVPALATSANLTFTYAGAGAAPATDLGLNIFDACGGTSLMTSCNSSGDVLNCVAPGSTIFIAVGSVNNSEGDFTLTITADNTGIPANDLCSAPIDISPAADCSWETVNGDNTDACPESFNAGCNQTNDPTTWYSITLPANAVGIDIRNVNNANIEVFDNDCADPAVGPSNPQGCQSGDSFIALTGGNTYLISVTNSGAAFDFELRTKVPPANDDCANAVSLALSTSIAGTTECATFVGENAASCDASPENLVWYSHDVGADTKTLTLSITNFSTGTINVAAWDGCGSSTYYNNDNNNEQCGNAIMLDIDCPTAGTTIFFAVSSTQAEEGSFDIEITETQAIVPANDDCTNATNIPITSNCTPLLAPVGSNEFACPETFAGGCGLDMEEVVWYQIDLPADATSMDLGINNYVGAGTPFFQVFTDCSGTGLDGSCYGNISAGDPANAGVNLDISAQAGTSIWVAFGSQGDDGGGHNLDVQINNTPPNDDPCNPEIFAGGGGTLMGTTECTNPDFFDPACQTNYENSVWYEYTLGAGETGVEVEVVSGTAGGNFGVAIVDQNGDCTSAPTIFPNASSCAGETEVVKAVCLPAGQTIHIEVGTSTANAGTFDITLTPIVPQASCIDNDDCANAQDLGQLTTDANCTVLSDCNEDACPDVVGSCNGGMPVNNVVWYTVQNDGMGDFISVEVSNATFTDPVVGVFVGNDCSGLTQIGPCTNGAGGNASTGPIDIDPNNPPIAGENYYIAVGSNGNDGGDFDLCIEIIGGCVNDDPCDAVQLTDGVTLSNPASTENCTPDLMNPNCTGSDINTVWYKFTMPAGTSTLIVEVDNVTFTGNYSLMVGEYVAGSPGCSNQNPPIDDDCSTGYTRLTIPCLEENTEYYIQVGSATAMDAGTFEITATAQAPLVPNDLCSQAEVIVIDPSQFCQWVTTPGTTIDACPDDVVSGSCDFNNGPTVWYQLTIPNDPAIALMDLNLTDVTQGQGMMSVFDNSCDPLSPIAGAGCGQSGELVSNVPITPGSTYLIAVGTGNDMPGTFELDIKIIAPPGNDLCQNAIVLGVGSSEMGTTECATFSNDFTLPVCAQAMNNSDVWYEIPITADMTAITIDVTSFTGAGNYGAGAYYATGPCALAPAIVEGAPVVDCTAGDKELVIPVKCLDPSITSIYVKVSTDSDDGDPSNGEEQGQFNISVSNDGPSCEYADECDDVVDVLTPETPADGTIVYNACTTGCLEYACPETAVSDCMFDQIPTVWFQVDTDLDAQQLYINITTAGTWTPIFAIYQGDCSGLTLVPGGTIAEPINCNTDDSTPDVSNVGIQTDVDGNPIQTYYIAVGADGVVDDPTFNICAATAIGTVACLGGIPPDYQNHTCNPAATFEITSRSNDPDGSLGLPLEGPFCPGEILDLHFEFFYDASATGNDWLQGIVPLFGEAVDQTSFDPSMIAVSPGGAQWFAEGVPQVNENVPNLCTYTDANGNLVLCNALCQACPCTGPLTAGSPLPGGWFWVTNGGGGCANDGTPQTMYGIPGGTQVNVEFDLQLQVKEYNDEAECNAFADKFSFALQTFSDGVTGCWEDPQGECLKDVNQIISYPIECELPPAVIATPNPKIICTGEDINVDVTTEDGSNLEIEIIVEDNPNVDGENDHTFFGSGTINDVLVNNSGSVQTVLYIMKALDPTITCPGPTDTLEVTIYPELLIEFDDLYVCEFQCADIAPNSITGGTGNYTSYEWSTGETGTSTINVCPTVPTTYVLTVTDDHGCSGTGEIEVDVKPKVKSFFDPEEVLFCQDGIEGNDDLITVTIDDGSPNYFFDWSFSPFGLEGSQSNDYIFFNGDSYQVEAEESFESFTGPYEVCVEIVDMFGCADTSCLEVTIQGAPNGSLELESPLVCGQTITNLVASFDQGSSVNGLDRFELYDCEGNFIELTSSDPGTFEDLDLEDNDCFVLVTYNIVGCSDVDTLHAPITTGEEAIVDGDSTICIGQNATISVTNASSFVNPTFEWDNTLNTSTITVSPDVTTTYIVTVTDGAGCSDIASFEVVVNPLPVISISGPTSFCTGSSTSLVVTSGSGASFTWTDASNTVISNTGSVMITNAGSYTVEVNIDGCVSDSTVVVTEDTNLNVNLNSPILCDNNPDTIFAGDGFAQYEWAFNNNVIVGEDTSFIEVSQEGSYSVTITDVTGCFGSDTVMIQNFNSPAAMVTDTIEVCRENTGIGPVTINFNDQVSGSMGVWGDTDLSGVDLSDLSSVSFEGIARDTYSFTFTTNTAMGTCEDVSYVMEVIVIRCPCPSVATLPIPDQCNNPGNVVNLNDYLTNPTVQIGSWSFISGPTTLTVNSDNLDLSSAAAGTYTVRWTIDNVAGNCPESSDQTIEVFEAPFAEIVSGPKTLCNEDTGQGPVSVDLNTFLVSGSSTGTWSQKSGTSVTGLPMVNATGLTAGEVLVFTYTTNTAQAPCEDIEIDVEITVRDCSCPFVTIADLPDLCNSGGTINLDDYITTDPSGLLGTWSINITPSPISGSILDPEGLLSGQYTVTYTLTDDPGAGCQREFTQTVLISRQPNAVAIGSGSPCNTNVSGNDPTSVNLFDLLDANPSAGTWSQTGGSPMLTIQADGTVEFDGQPINSSFEFTYTTNVATPPCTDIMVPVNVLVVDCNCPNIDINPVQPMCNTMAELDLSTLEGPMIGSGSWSVTGPSGNVPLTGTVLTVMDIPAGDYNLTYTLDPAPGGSCQLDTTQVLRVEEQNSATVLMSAQACSEDDGNNGNVIDLFELVTDGDTSGKWYDESGAEITIPNFADFQQYNPGDMVNITYVVSSEAPCMDITYPVVVEILDCTCPPIQVMDFEICSDQGTIDLTPYGDANKPGHFESTDVTIVSQNMVDVSMLNGNFNIDYVIDSPDPNCPDRNSFVMTVIREMNPGIAEETSLCVGDDDVISLFDLLEGEDVGGVWTETSNQPSSSGAFDPTAGTFNTTGQAVGSYTFEYAFTNNSPCPDVSSQVRVTIQNIPPVDAGEAQTLDCDLLSANIGGTPANDAFTYAWTHDGGQTVPNADQAQTSVNFPGVFTLTVTNKETGCTSSDQVTIDVSTDRPVAEVESTNITCFGDADGTITVINMTGGTTPYEYSNNGGATFQSSPIFTNLSPGSYQMVLQDAGGCVIELGTVELIQPAALALELGTNQVVKLDEEISLDITQFVDLDRITNLTWTITTESGDSVLCNEVSIPCLTYVHKAKENATICVEMSDENGCTISDCVTINVIRVRDITFPQIFTPNDDGVNNVFFVQDNDVALVNKFFIFDRWGNKVFALENVPPNDPTYGWNGKFNGKDVAQGVYVYLIELTYIGDEKEVETFSADITLIR